jgi:uracil-DNA glycosylase
MLMLPGRAAATVSPTLEALLAAVRGCRACEAHLPLGRRPVLRAGATARILVVGQAPGVRVHRTGLPWDDPSGALIERESGGVLHWLGELGHSVPDIPLAG